MRSPIIARDPASATAQRNLPEAQRLFGEALRIRQRMAESDPANAEWQRDLAVSHSKLYHLARASGDEATAKAELQSSFAVLHGRSTKQKPFPFDDLEQTEHPFP